MTRVSDLESRATSYQFDLERDVAWSRIDEEGVLVPAPYAASLGFPASASGDPWIGWALALVHGWVFDLFEEKLVAFAQAPLIRAGLPRSATLLVDEERKHQALFRRFGEHLARRAPDEAARLRELFDVDVAAVIFETEAPRDPDIVVYAGWLRTLLFEEHTIHLHRVLAASRLEVQPTWRDVHAVHAREEVQHVATDVAALEAVALDPAARKTASYVFLATLGGPLGELLTFGSVWCLAAELGRALEGTRPRFVSTGLARELREGASFKHLRRATVGLGRGPA